MTKNFQSKFFNYLLKNNIENFVGVPDSTLKDFITEGLKQKKIIITTREEEAMIHVWPVLRYKSNKATKSVPTFL